MNKEQFLAMSLPYGLRVAVTDDEDILSRVINLYGGNYDSLCKMNYYKPILHQLSDLTKEIKHKGERFIPITKLNELFGYKEVRMVHYINSGLGWQLDPSRSPSAISFGNMINPILKLVEWHFDIAELIEKGEAIDINTLPKNPYK